MTIVERYKLHQNYWGDWELTDPDDGLGWVFPTKSRAMHFIRNHKKWEEN